MKIILLLILLSLIPVQSFAVEVDVITSDDVVLLVDAFDTGTGIESIRYSFDNQSWSDWEPYEEEKDVSLAELPDGAFTIYVQIVDFAGHVSETCAASAVKDVTSPTLNGVTFSGTIKINIEISN